MADGKGATHRIVENKACDVIAEAATWYADYLNNPTGYIDDESRIAGKKAAEEILAALETIYGSPYGPVA